MDANDYQELTGNTDIYTEASNSFIGAAIESKHGADIAVEWCKFAYCVGKLNGEAGEIAEVVFKALRDEGGVLSEARRQQLLKELGDIQWYVARIADLLDYDLGHVMQVNIDKLADRKERGLLSGSGDER